jgi:hydroxymethylpyrimidine/phosphomethylpyrimidine kinase
MDRGDKAGVSDKLPIALTIAGSDSGGGAGVQADLKTFAALGVYGASVVTALTAQNTKGVRAIHYAPPAIVTAQIEAVMEDFAVAAIKIGMLGSAEIVGAAAEALEHGAFRRRHNRHRERSDAIQGNVGRPTTPGSPRHFAPRDDDSALTRHVLGGTSPQPSPASGRGGEFLLPHAGEGGAKRRIRAFIVYDPVMIASSGDTLSGAGFVEAVREKLLPLIDCLTPNLAEAAALLGEPVAGSEADMARQGAALIKLGPRAALMKGGHLNGDEAIDLLVTPEGVHRYAAPRIASRNLHGTGCTLSSAIAANIVLGAPLPEAVAAAKAFVREAIERSRRVTLGGGAGPLIQARLSTKL